jgi:hypothetical protein
MVRKNFYLIIVLTITLCTMSVVFAEVNEVTPSTNELNEAAGWAHVKQDAIGVGYTDLKFISMRAFWSCFEYRTDGDTSQVVANNGGVNYNSAITDGLYPYFCLNNDERTETIFANEYVEVRMVFGAETDERFDWTRFEVLPVPNKDDCKKGGWETLSRDDGSPFKNQGDCIQYLNTGK